MPISSQVDDDRMESYMCVHYYPCISQNPYHLDVNAYMGSVPLAVRSELKHS